MGLIDWLKEKFTNEVTVTPTIDSVIFQNENRRVEFKPFLVLDEKGLVIAVGQDVPPSVQSRKLEFLTDVSMADKDRIIYLLTFLRYGVSFISYHEGKTFIPPAVTIKSVAAVESVLPNSKKVFSEALTKARFRRFNFID